MTAGSWYRLGFIGIAGAACALVGVSIGAQDPALDLKTAAFALDAKRYTDAAKQFAAIGNATPLIADYAAWYRGQAELGGENYSAVEEALTPVFGRSPKSPLEAKSWLLAGQAAEKGNQPQHAIELLRKHYDALPQPSGDLALANAYDAARDYVSAAMYLQRIHSGYPMSAEAVQAATRLIQLRFKLGAGFPTEMPAARMGRAVKLLDGGKIAEARREFVVLAAELGGADRDTARVKIGAADYQAKSTAAALRYLRALQVSSPDADAERLYYLVLCEERNNNAEQVMAELDQLGRLYPSSPWRLKALTAAANRYLVTNQIDAYEPLYRACYETFPKSQDAAVCHWKVTWGHYIRRRDDAVAMLKSHLRSFPQSEAASAALYFLGHKSEEAGNPSDALAYYREAVGQYPNEYYGMQARSRIAKLGEVAPSAEVSQFLASLPFPKRARTQNFEPTEASKTRFARVDFLNRAGLKDLAEAELRFAAQTEDQPHLMAMKIGAQVVKPELGIRYIKRYAAGYLFYQFQSTPSDFWKQAFPLPYRTDLERNARKNGLDPFLVAALIRQESEFDAKVVSNRNARGLMQIEPVTGLEQSKKIKLTGFTTPALFEPSVNLQLGTHIFKEMIGRFDGSVEAALAAYNAGPTRANAWLTWAQFKEPPEFVETVPFTQTRGYIQAVLRNADMYRRIWSGD